MTSLVGTCRDVITVLITSLIPLWLPQGKSSSCGIQPGTVRGDPSHSGTNRLTVERIVSHWGRSAPWDRSLIGRGRGCLKACLLAGTTGPGTVREDREAGLGSGTIMYDLLPFRPIAVWVRSVYGRNAPGHNYASLINLIDHQWPP